MFKHHWWTFQQVLLGVSRTITSQRLVSTPPDYVGPSPCPSQENPSPIRASLGRSVRAVRSTEGPGSEQRGRAATSSVGSGARRTTGEVRPTPPACARWRDSRVNARKGSCSNTVEVQTLRLRCRTERLRTDRSPGSRTELRASRGGVGRLPVPSGDWKVL